MNVAIFGGSFDAFHIGHQKIIEQALLNIKLKKLFVIPTFCNPVKKKTSISAKNRAKTITKQYRKNYKICVCNYEILKKRKSYSINTILYIKNKYKNITNLYLIIGADNLAKIRRWRRWSDTNGIKNNIKLVVVTRNNIKIKCRNIKIHKILNVVQNISSSNIKLKTLQNSSKRFSN